MAGRILVVKRSADAPAEVQRYLNLWFDIINDQIMIPNSSPDEPDPIVESNGPNGQRKYPLSRFPQVVLDWFYADPQK